MPRFTLIKHPEGAYDTEVTVTFECEMVDVAKAHYDDFLQGAGFSLPDDAPFERKLTQDDFLAKEEDWMWNDAFASKFSYDEVYSSPAPVLKDDGILGVTGEDNIIFGNFSQGSPSNDTITFF